MAANKHALDFLDTLERSEQALLTWGLVDGFFSEEEIEERSSAFFEQCVQGGHDPGYASEFELVRELCDDGLLWRLPYSADGTRYRTRFAEAIRLFSTLRQIFPDAQRRAWRSAPRLVSDFRLLRTPRRFPRRHVPVGDLLERIRARVTVSPIQVDITSALLGKGSSHELRLADFQVNATARILAAAKVRRVSGTVVCAGTGSGKTLAFYLPTYLAIAETLDAGAWTRCLAIYPRKELLKDQLREAIANARRMRPALTKHNRRGVVIGALYGDVPADASGVTGKWPQHTYQGRPASRCPYLVCPECGGAMVWTGEDVSNGIERLMCVRRGCDGRLEHDEVRLTRERMFASPPDLLFTTTEMMNQRLSAVGYGRLFGIGIAPEQQPRFVLIDEVHTYEGTDGAQVAYLLRRWRHRARTRPHFVGLSATLADASRFFSELVGVGPGDISEITPGTNELDYEGAEYQVALRGDPATGTSLLSTSIQSAMLLRRIIAPAPGCAHLGSRVFAFTDNLDAVNRLYHDLLDAEGRNATGGLIRQLGSLANLRARTSPNAGERFDVGQNWAIVEDAGHSLADGETARVGRTSSQDPGVAPDADIVVATSSLEVGFDDPEVGAVLQHKAPQTASAFLQRKGRAGRRRSTRPWTVAVLSDWGRDRRAYQSYERLFSPTIDARYLPLDNPAILRMQGTYTLIDWLGAKIPLRDGPDPWLDVASPARPGTPKARRQKVYEHWLRRLLDQADVREEFATYLERALNISSETATALLWEAPRSLLMNAVPTLLRRLETDFSRADGQGLDLHTWQAPLPDFVPRALFSDLQLPEIAVRLPAYRRNEARSELMPFIQALTEFAPGRVSRRFGVVDANERHWVDPGADGTNSIPVASFCPSVDRRDLGHFRFVEHGQEIAIRVFRPHAVNVVLPAARVRTSSNATLEWRTELVAPTEPHSVDVPVGSAWATVIDAVRFCTHHLGLPMEVRRFAIGAQATIVRDGFPRVDRTIGFHEVTPNGSDERVALGVAADVDAIELRIRYRAPLHVLCNADGRLLRGLRNARFRFLVSDATSLDGIANFFQREWLAQVYLASVTIQALQTNTDVSQARAAVLSGVSVVSPNDLAATILHWDDQGGSPAQSGQPRRLQELQGLLQRADVMRAVNDAASVLVDAPNETWEPWLRARFKATLGAAITQAAHDVCPQTDPDTLYVDVEGFSRAHQPDPRSLHDTLWLTESSVGGGGVVEALLEAYADDPRRFFNLLEGALGPSDLENVADDLGRTVACAASGQARYDALKQSFVALRTAESHAGKASALAALRANLSDAGILPTPTFLVALNARILGPGTNDRTDAFLARLVAEWDAAEQRLGIDVDTRALALVHSRDTALETALAIVPEGRTDDARAVWRYGVLYGMLWLRGSDLRSQMLRPNNPFGRRIECDRLLVLAAVPQRREAVSVQDPSWFENVSKVLARDGVAELTGPVGDETRLAGALHLVSAEAIDVAGVLVHARLSGVRRDDNAWRATIELPEALQ